jgi:hypothetical protein
MTRQPYTERSIAVAAKQRVKKIVYRVELWRKKTDREAEKTFPFVRAENTLAAADIAMHTYGVSMLAKVVVRSETVVEACYVDVMVTEQGMKYCVTEQAKAS